MTDRQRNVGDVLASGTQIEEFVIEHELRSGGFGVTYLAQDRSLGRVVAIKEYLPREWGGRRADGSVGPRSASCAEDYQWGLTRFLDEARILARLDHARIVRVYRVIEAWGTAYMVMEYVEGRNLEEVLGTEGPWPEEKVRALLEALLPGLATVHRAGLLHRDIKPANLMLRGDGTPVLIDFGAARYAAGAHSRSLTSVLTPGYAPHEQYQSAGKQGPWTDIYSLGAVAYRALTGRAPAEATERVDSIARAARVEAHARQDPDPLPAVATVAAGKVSDAFGAAITAALAVWPEDRPRDVAAWRALWGDAEAAEPLVGRTDDPAEENRLVPGSAVQPGFTGDRAAKSMTGRRLTYGAAALLVAAGIAVGIIVNRGGNGNIAPNADARFPTTPMTNPAGEVVDSPTSPDRVEDAEDADGLPATNPTRGAVVDSSTSPEQVETALDLSRTAWRVLQTGLAREGFNPGPPDGQPGRGTREAVRRWQEARGDDATGYLTAESARALREAGSTRPPAVDEDTALVLNLPVGGTLGSDEVNVWTFDGIAGTDVSVSVVSADFDPEVSLRSPTGDVIGTDDDGGEGLNAQLVTNLPGSGRYRVDVRTVGGVGDYALVVRTVRDLSLATPANGDLNVDVLGADGVDTEVWTFDGTAGQVVAVEAAMDDYLPVVRLRSPIGGEQISIGYGGRLAAVLPQSGEYRIDVVAYESGSYEIEMRITDLAGALTLGASSRGFLDNGSPGNIHAFEGRAGQQISLEVRSDYFNTVAAVWSSTGEMLAYDDGGGSGTNSRLAAFLPDSGLYFVDVGSSGDSGGAYSVTLTDASDTLAGCLRQVSLTGRRTYERNDTLDGTCSTVHYPDGEHAVYYGFTLDQAARVVIEMTSGDVDSWLALRSGAPPGNDMALEENDDGGPGVDARIERFLAAGSYTIEATTLDAGETGDFMLTLTVDEEDNRAGDVAHEQTLVFDSAYSAAIDSPGDEDVYRIVVAYPGVLTVYTTGTTDTFGELLDASGGVLVSNDDGDDLNFKLSTQVVADTYYVRVRHYDRDETGRYQVAAEFDFD